MWGDEYQRCGPAYHAERRVGHGKCL